jgi:hypothetical protein
LLWRPTDWSHRSIELEPNDEPAEANPLRLDAKIHGFLGKRKSRTYGDVDMYTFELALGASHMVEARLSPLPNVDLVLELIRKGDSQPLWLSDSGRVGEPEVIANLGLRGGTYYLRVRERFQGVRWPTENVSDAYGISVRLLDDDPTREREPNDGLENAATLVPGTTRHGYMGFRGDRDLYCFQADLAPVAIDVSRVRRGQARPDRQLRRPGDAPATRAKPARTRTG